MHTIGCFRPQRTSDKESRMVNVYPHVSSVNKQKSGTPHLPKYEYIPQLMNGILARRHPKRQQATIANSEPLPTAELVSNKRYHFMYSMYIILYKHLFYIISSPSLYSLSHISSIGCWVFPSDAPHTGWYYSSIVAA